jgi:glycosyltransferase involved in cell wall biosynthesis
MVVPEALAAGLPIIALSGTSVSRTVEDHSCGVVVEGDAQWGEALMSVTHDRERFSIAARRAYLHHFSHATWLQKYMSLAATVTQTERGSGP